MALEVSIVSCGAPNPAVQALVNCGPNRDAKIRLPIRLLGALALGTYAAVPVLAVLVASQADAVDPLLLDAALASVPMLLLAACTWRLVWPRWKLFAKLVVHPSLYLTLAAFIGHWCILVAWVHQGLLGLGVHVWFCQKHGFTWYSVEDPGRYVALSKEMVGQP